MISGDHGCTTWHVIRALLLPQILPQIRDLSSRGSTGFESRPRILYLLLSTLSLSSPTMAASESDSFISSKLKEFDAFPKLPSSYKARSESRGILTILVALAAFVLLLNDVGDYLYGWPDYEFGVSQDSSAYMNVNVDLIINMHCEREWANMSLYSDC